MREPSCVFELQELHILGPSLFIAAVPAVLIQLAVSCKVDKSVRFWTIIRLPLSLILSLFLLC